MSRVTSQLAVPTVKSVTPETPKSQSFSLSTSAVDRQVPPVSFGQLLPAVGGDIATGVVVPVPLPYGVKDLFGVDPTPAEDRPKFRMLSLQFPLPGWTPPLPLAKNASDTLPLFWAAGARPDIQTPPPWPHQFGEFR